MPDRHHSGRGCACVYFVVHFVSFPFILDLENKKGTAHSCVSLPNKKRQGTHKKDSLTYPLVSPCPITVCQKNSSCISSPGCLLHQRSCFFVIVCHHVHVQQKWFSFDLCHYRMPFYFRRVVALGNMRYSIFDSTRIIHPVSSCVNTFFVLFLLFCFITQRL